MSVTPGRLKSVTTNHIPATQLEALVGVTDIWPDDIPQHVRLTPTGGAGTGSAEEPQRKEGLTPIAPLDRQLAADLLDVLRFEAHGQSLAVIYSLEQPFLPIDCLASSWVRRRSNNFSFFPAFLCS